MLVYNPHMDIPDCSNNILSLTNTIEEVTSEETLIWGMPMYACWIVIVFLLLCSAFFTSCEDPYSNCNKYHFKAEAEKGKRSAKVVTYLVDHFDKTLITVLISNNTVATLMTSLASLIFYQICLSNGWGSGIEVVLSTVVMGIIIYIFGDTLPKVISRSMPNRLAKLMCYPLLILQCLLYPIVWIFYLIVKLLNKAFHIKDENLLSKDDLLSQVDDAVVEETEEDKLFENDEKKILDNILAFDQRRVSSVYTPLEKVFSLDISSLQASKINAIAKDSPYSRIPIYEDSKDNIVGVLVLTIYFKEYCLDPHVSLVSILENPVVIRSDEELDDAFKILNTKKVHMGIVKDNSGKVLGIVTMEDILEELVDDIAETGVKKEVKNA